MLFKTSFEDHLNPYSEDFCTKYRKLSRRQKYKIENGQEQLSNFSFCTKLLLILCVCSLAPILAIIFPLAFAKSAYNTLS